MPRLDATLRVIDELAGYWIPTCWACCPAGPHGPPPRPRRVSLEAILTFCLSSPSAFSWLQSLITFPVPYLCYLPYLKYRTAPLSSPNLPPHSARVMLQLGDAVGSVRQLSHLRIHSHLQCALNLSL